MPPTTLNSEEPDWRMVNDRIFSTLHSSVRIYHTLNIQTSCH